MADERDFELLDDYLTNRLTDSDRLAFEQKIKADPDLQHEYALQKRLIQGIKDARVAQLKSMLNQVPVPSASAGNAVAGKVILGALVTLIIAAAAFWYYRDEPVKVEQTTGSPAQQQEEQQTPPVQKPAVPLAKEETAITPQRPVIRQKQVQETDKNQTSAGTEHSRPSLAKKPDPLSAPVAKSKSGEEAVSVSTDNSNAAYSFHYKLENKQLVLFGPFQENSFDVIELSDGEQAVRSLYYQGNYYLLSNASSEIRPLTQVTDSVLLQRLKKQRVSE